MVANIFRDIQRDRDAVALGSFDLEVGRSNGAGLELTAFQEAFDRLTIGFHTVLRHFDRHKLQQRRLGEFVFELGFPILWDGRE